MLICSIHFTLNRAVANAGGLSREMNHMMLELGSTNTWIKYNMPIRLTAKFPSMPAV